MKYLKTVLVLLISLFLASCALISDSSNNNSCEIYKISSNTKRIFHGFIKAQHIIDLSFQTQGNIIYFPYTTGDFVKKGVVIARLDGILYTIQKQQEIARLNEAKIRKNRYDAYFKRVDMLHKAGAISDNDWDDAYFNLKSAMQDIEIQNEKIKYINKQISYNEIKAPFSGYIFEKKSDIGALASVGVPVVSMIASKETEVDTMVDSSVINFLKINQNVDVKRKDKIYKGKIAHISKSSLKTGGYLTRIFLEDNFLELKEGMSVDVEFNIDSSSIYIPLKYVLFDNMGNKFVYKIVLETKDRVKIKKVIIETLNLNNDLIQVVSGLEINDKILICSNLNKLKDGKIIEL